MVTQLAKIAMVTATIAANTNDTQPHFNKSQEPVSNVNKQNVVIYKSHKPIFYS